MCVVVPAYKEALNLTPLCERITAAMKKAGMKATILVIDDNSRDGSVEAIEKVATSCNARIMVRTTERGLSSAVIRGFLEANADLMVCMDADLQHPPEKVLLIARSLFVRYFSTVCMIGARDV